MTNDLKGRSGWATRKEISALVVSCVITSPTLI